MLATAASSFFIPLILSAPGAAQPVEVYASVGGAVSSNLVRDDVATPALRQLLGGTIDREVTARPAPAPVLAAGVRFAARPRVKVELEAGWSPAALEATEGDATRHVQDLHVVEGSLGVSWAMPRGLEVGAAAGVLSYLTERRAMFAEGSSAAPAVCAHIGLRLPFWEQRVSVRGSAQVHRFGTAAIRQLGGTDGVVTRLQLGARVRLAEVRR